MDNFIAHILVVDDDEGIRSLVKKYLNENQFLVTTADSAEDAKEKIKTIKFDLIILDIMMPGKSGLDFIEENKNNLESPIILLTAKGNTEERVEGLEIGADDYLAKPFSFSELLARIEVLNRRTNPEVKETSLKVGSLSMNLLTRQVHRQGIEIDLQPREFRLLEFLMKRSNQVVTRTMLLEGVWEYHFDPQTNVIDVHISRLRSKIDKPFDSKEMLFTERGAGYALRSDD